MTESSINKRVYNLSVRRFPARYRSKRLQNSPKPTAGGVGSGAFTVPEPFFYKAIDDNGVEYIRTKYTIATTGGVSMYADDNASIPSIFESIPLGNGLVWEDGKITVDGELGGGTMDHNDLLNRNAVNQHGISAITGLQAALDAKSPIHSHPYRADSWNPTYLSNTGTFEPETGTERPRMGGLSISQAYSANWPTMYGNLLSMRGTGDNQLFLGWSGVSGGHADAYIRSRRDVTDANWSGWARIWTSANLNPDSKVTIINSALNLDTPLATGSCNNIFTTGYRPSGTTLPTANYIAGLRVKHYTAPNENYENQLVFGAGTETPYTRTYNNGSWGEWRHLWHSGNCNRYEVDWTCEHLWTGNSIYTNRYGTGYFCTQYGTKPIINTGYQEAYYGDWTRIATAGSVIPKNFIIGSTGKAYWDGNGLYVGNSTTGIENLGNSMYGVSNHTRTFGWSNTIFETYKDTNILSNRLVIGGTSYGTVAAPLYYDLAFRGYYGGDYARIRSREISGTSGEGILDIFVRGNRGGSTAEPDLVMTLDAAKRVTVQGQIKNYGAIYVSANDSYGTVPSISLAIGDNDSGFRWENDGYIRGVGNGVNCWGWTGGEFQTHKRTVIGAGTDVELVTRHVSGKHYQNDSDSDLYLNWRSGLPIHTGGNMSIGGLNAACNATLHVHGNILADGGITMLSDMRLKNRIERAKSVLPSILDIDVFRYTLKSDDTQRVYIGVSAQQIQGVWNEFVHGKETLSLDYAQMAAYVAIKGLQETKLWMDEKDQKIVHLEKRIVELENNIA